MALVPCTKFVRHYTLTPQRLVRNSNGASKWGIQRNIHFDVALLFDERINLVMQDPNAECCFNKLS